MRLVHVELAEANAFVAKHHRHHKPSTGHRFSLGAENDGRLVGVSICGRAVARATSQTDVIEVLRLCTDGTKNACSFLYAASAVAARALGYCLIQTYILATETGISLKASGWGEANVGGGGDWNCPSRGGRRTDQPMVAKVRWVKVLGEPRRFTKKQLESA